MFIKYTLIVTVTTMVATSMVGCSKTYYQYSPHIISNRDTTEIYILNTDLSPGLLSIWLKNPKKPNTKVLVIDSVSFERMSIKSSNTVSTRITGTLSNN